MTLLLSGCASAPAGGDAPSKQEIPRDAAAFEQRLGGTRVFLPDGSNYWCVAIGGYSFLSATMREVHSGRIIYWKNEFDFKVELHRLEGVDVSLDDAARFITRTDEPEPALPAGAQRDLPKALYQFEFELGEPHELESRARWGQFGGSAYKVDGELKFVWVLQSGHAEGSIIDAIFWGRTYKAADGQRHVATWDWSLVEKQGLIPLWRYRVFDSRHPKWDLMAKRIEQASGNSREEEGKILGPEMATEIAQLADLEE